MIMRHPGIPCKDGAAESDPEIRCRKVLTPANLSAYNTANKHRGIRRTTMSKGKQRGMRRAYVKQLRAHPDAECWEWKVLYFGRLIAGGICGRQAEANTKARLVFYPA